jgi:hypothetical protein
MIKKNDEMRDEVKDSVHWSEIEVNRSRERTACYTPLLFPTFSVTSLDLRLQNVDAWHYNGRKGS